MEIAKMEEGCFRAERERSEDSRLREQHMPRSRGRREMLKSNHMKAGVRGGEVDG